MLMSLFHIITKILEKRMTKTEMSQYPDKRIVIKIQQRKHIGISKGQSPKI